MKPYMIFLVISSIILIIFIFIMPKKLKYHEMYSMSILAIMVGKTADLILAVKLSLYILVTEVVDYSPIVASFIIYPGFNIIILNYFPYRESLIKKGFYIFIWTIVSLLYELISVKFGYITYKGWNLLYSAMVYPVIIIFFSYNLYFYRRLVDNSFKN